MNQDIHYSGYTAQPSDYECPDGTLASVMNLIPEDEELRTIFPPSTVVLFPDDVKPLFIHDVKPKPNYIAYDSLRGYLFYYVEGDKTDGKANLTPIKDGTAQKSFASFQHLCAIGNILIAVCYSDSNHTADALHYLLWKDNDYVYLGTHLPEIDLSFGLVGHPRFTGFDKDDKWTEDDYITIVGGIDGVEGQIDTIPDTGDQRQRTTTYVMAGLNKLIAEQATNRGRFCMPFLVRYALRLFDGTSLVMHSAPILMLPVTGKPVVYLQRSKTNDGGLGGIEAFIMACDLDFKFVNSASAISALTKWKDIIQSVDIYVSKPIYTYNQAGTITSFNKTDPFKVKFVGRLAYEGENDTDYSLADKPFTKKLNGTEIRTAIQNGYREWSYNDIYTLYRYYRNAFASRETGGRYPHHVNADEANYNTENHCAFTFELPDFDTQSFDETVKDTGNFFLLKSYLVDDILENNIGVNRTVVEVGKEYLQSLVNREQLRDDYRSHDTIIPKYEYNYNGRINFANIRRSIFEGFTNDGMFCYVDATQSLTHLSEYEWADDAHTQYLYYAGAIGVGSVLPGPTMSFRIFIKESQKTIRVESEGTLSTGFYTGTSLPDFGAYVFYPNPNAFKMEVIQGSDVVTIPLKPHALLQGAVGFLPLGAERKTGSTPTADYSTDTWIDEPGKLLTSEINNPIYFPVTGINTIGTGDIIGLAAAAKALSQGQFGQFPLYAFTTEGVWALSVGSTGSFVAIQPITRDVCTNHESITQLDSSVLFTSDRGIMVIEGSNADCISEYIDTAKPFQALSLPHADKLITGWPADTFAYIPFRDYLKKAKFIYDYTNQHIIAYNPEKKYAYVFSYKSKSWGMMANTIVSHLNSYPEALAVNSSNYIVNFSDRDYDDIPAGIAITRPLKLGGADIHKTIDTVIQRGHFKKGEVQSALFGSRDGFSEQLIWTSRDHFLRYFSGTPYKYFRIAIFTNLPREHGVYGASIQYIARLLNQPR